MQNEINAILQWLNVNKLSINATKTKFIIFKSKNKRLEAQITLKIDNEIIHEVSQAKFLGIIIDEILTWKNRSTGIIAKIRHYTNKYIEANLLCGIGLSISNLWQSSMGLYIPNKH
jgi:hypothetical protein